MDYQKNKKIWLLLISMIAIVVCGCKKDEYSTLNITNGKSKAVFNPSLTYGKMTDQDGNTYKTITIGTQTWMAENLRTTKYRDGSPIPFVTVNDEWIMINEGAYCNYNNTTNNDTIATLGRLYNWLAVAPFNPKNIAPEGWHVPSSFEWYTLISSLREEAGGKLKEIGNTHWLSPNVGATNESGFTALPSGKRGMTGEFTLLGEEAIWWSTDEYFGDLISRVYYHIYNHYDFCSDNIIDFKHGLAVRLLKD